MKDFAAEGVRGEAHEGGRDYYSDVVSDRGGMSFDHGRDDALVRRYGGVGRNLDHLLYGRLIDGTRC